MKDLRIIIILLMTVVSVNINSQSNTETHFEIVISEWTMISNNYYKITLDSIVVVKKNNGMNGNESFSMKLSENQRTELYSLISKMKQDSLKSNYVNHSASDSDYEYDITLKRANKTLKIHIYKVKVEPIFGIITKVNSMLPKEFRINYTNEYLKR